MPFTPAHSAAVLPFLKIKPHHVSATCLVAGSVAPDFEYFFKLSVDSMHSHTLWGIIYFDIPVVVILSLLLHGIIKKNLIRNLPAFLQRKFQALVNLNFIATLRERPLVCVSSAALGAISHIVWDAFTHQTGFFVKILSFYNGAFIPYDGVRYPLWYALQHISTIVGLSILFLYILFMKQERNIILYRPVLTYWFYLIVITIGVVAIRFAIKSSDYNLGNLVVSCITGLCIGLVVCGLIKFKNTVINQS
jgi:hypothetical protein